MWGQEFVAIVMACDPGVRLAPLTTAGGKTKTKTFGMALPLLPVANRPLIWYQLRLLEQAGFSSAIFVSPASERPALVEAIARYSGGSLRATVEDIAMKDVKGTADVLRALLSRGAMDKVLMRFPHASVLVLPCDLVALHASLLHAMVESHRVRDATITVLFTIEDAATRRCVFNVIRFPDGRGAQLFSLSLSLCFVNI